MRPIFPLTTRPRPGRLTLAACVFLSAACASPGEVPGQRASPEAVLLTVENGVDRDVRVYLLRGDSPIRLGAVTSLRSRTFRIPRVLLPGLAPLKLRGVALGGGTIESASVIAEPGDRVVWGLGPGLRHSSLRVHEP